MATNKIKAKVLAIKNSGSLYRVDLATKGGTNLALVCFDCAKKVGDIVEVGVNPTNVSIAKDSKNLSISNQILAQISGIEKGEILTKISAIFEDVSLKSIITTDSANRLNLAPFNEVVFLVKSTDMFIV